MAIHTRPEQPLHAGGRVLLGPLLTGRQFARRLGLAESWVRAQPFILRIGGRLSVGSAYPAFQIAEDTLRLDVCFLAMLLRRRGTDLEACDWLVRSQPALGHLSPIAHLDRGGPLQRAVEALPGDSARDEREVRPELEALRTSWLTARRITEADRWGNIWDRTARQHGAHPLGV